MFIGGFPLRPPPHPFVSATPRPPMQHLSLTSGVLFVLGPSAVMVGAIWLAIWGDNGVVARQEVLGELAQARARLAEVERANQRLLLDVRALERDPAVLERTVADELQWARPEATVYRFDPLGPPSTTVTPARRAGRP